MAIDVPRPALKDRKALVIGIANEHSIAYGCAKAFHELGAEVAITYLNDKARRLLGWRPRYDFARALESVAAGENFRSPLMIAVGKKGYHPGQAVPD